MPMSSRLLPLAHAFLTWFALIVCATPIAPAAEPPASSESDFTQEIRPLLARYCLDCHSTEKPKGDLDLEQFRSLPDIRKHPRIWQGVVEQLHNGEMPPKDKPQPSAPERQRLESWVQSGLNAIALSKAGDPGPVILRRLSNAEYTYTLRDLTGVASLDPAREFPVDGAAGEGFMNTGAALVMSPTLLTKYLDAARGIAQHAVLLPDGIRFSPSTSRRDWTEEILGQIRDFYRQYTDPRGSTQVHLQGLVWETNEGGRLPLARYFAALQNARDLLAKGTQSLEQVARETGLSPKYLATLQAVLNQPSNSFLIERVRSLANSTTGNDPVSLTAWIAPWQQALWKFDSVGHIGKVGGPKAWMEPVTPLLARQEFRLPLTNTSAAPSLTIRLQASDAGDGATDDTIVWERPRLVAPGRPDVLLRDLRAVSKNLAQGRTRVIATAAACLAAAAEAAAHASPETLQVADLARRHAVDAPTLQAWLDTLGIRTGGAAMLTGHFTDRIESSSGYNFVQGWGQAETPLLVANASDQDVRVPGNLRAHGIALHPSPTLQAAVSWRSPIDSNLRVEVIITHAHPECGNGVTWSLEARRGTSRQRLATGIAQGSKPVRPEPVAVPNYRSGDVLSLLVGPRDGNHACDLTAVDLIITEVPEDGAKSPRVWNLADDVSPRVLAGNPHADRQGNADVWHFHTEPVSGDRAPAPSLPAGSLLARWRAATDSIERSSLASGFQQLLESGPPSDPKHPDTLLHRQVFAPNGPLWRSLLAQQSNGPLPASLSTTAHSPAVDSQAGLDPALFGTHPDGSAVEPASLCLQAPASLEFTIPAELAEGAAFVASATLHPKAGPEASVQFRAEVRQGPTWVPVEVPDPQTPFVVADNSPARRRLEGALSEFRQLFPAALCYSKIVPVDEVVTLTLFYREDDTLQRLMLGDAETARLNRLWDELHYVSHDALTLVDAFAQLMEYATQDADPKVFEPLREPIHTRAAQFRQHLLDTEPRHVDAVLEFAPLAYRRPLGVREAAELRALYARLRQQELPHDDAIRMTLARVLVAPSFLYRIEEPQPGTEAKPVSDWELASRLSYFLWSSAPDAPLLAAAAAGELRNPDTLVHHAKRMLQDPRVRRLATEFGCQWLHVHGFDELDEKSERHFPTFAGVRGALYEEAILFFTDFFQRDLPVASLLDADHTFLNETLARHYGIEGVNGETWQRVEHVRSQARGGILGLGATLAKQSGASRTSPILRGNWVSEVLLGEKLPRPPKDVPRLPEDEATETLTVRELVERHSQDPRCAGCHVRIDPYGFALEGYDPIGRARTHDLADRPIVTAAKTADGVSFDGIDGLRQYLLHQRRDAFFGQFCRKLLGYALGRGVQLSDTPLLQQIHTDLDAHGGRVSVAIESILRSRQFREIRGRDTAQDD
jgi:hypothetical protein